MAVFTPCTRCKQEMSEADALCSIWDGNGSAHFDCFYDRNNLPQRNFALPAFAYDRLVTLGDDRVRFFQRKPARVDNS